MSKRKPYPFPQFQNDDNFKGLGATQKHAYKTPTHIAQTKDPFNRLYNTCTLSSGRREAYHFDPQAPNDSLDFILKSTYNNHREFLKDKNETLVQSETLNLPHSRILKNKEIIIPPAPYPLNHPVKITTYPRKEDLHSVDMIIEGPHTQTTNPGYSRKPDGGFFTT